MKPTKEQHRQHLIDGIGERCLVCDSELYCEWTDYNGEGRCCTCGTTYQLLGDHMRDEFKAEMNLTTEQVAKRYCNCFPEVPLLREFWQATHSRIPFGTYLGSSPHTHEQMNWFGEWLFRNADRLSEDFAESFNWQRIREKYATHAEAAAGI